MRFLTIICWTGFILAPTQVVCGDQSETEKLYDPVYAKTAESASTQLEAFRKKTKIPGLTISVGLEGKLVWSAAFGVSDYKQKTPLNLTVVFPIGSTSKALTSLAIGKLYEQGKLDMDAPIQQYVPYFPEKAHAITVRQLLGHQAGIRHYNTKAGEYHNTRQFSTLQEAIAVFKDDPLLFEPATKYSYSTYGFTLLSAAIESISGEDFLTYMDNLIFKPLKLDHTGPDQMNDKHLVRVSEHHLSPFNGEPYGTRRLNVSNKWAGGGFVSSSEDMVRLGTALLNGDILSAKTRAMLFTPQTLGNGKDSGVSYAMGWRSWTTVLPVSGKSVRTANHGGVANGAMSFFILFPDERLVISLNGNLNFKPFMDFGRLTYTVADLFLTQREKNKMN